MFCYDSGEYVFSVVRHTGMQGDAFACVWRWLEDGFVVVFGKEC